MSGGSEATERIGWGGRGEPVLPREQDIGFPPIGLEYLRSRRQRSILLSAFEVAV
jgi:hypothetical protein